jgi:MSHA biogenesis protein MshO
MRCRDAMIRGTPPVTGQRLRGLTLVEMVVVIVITGIVAAAVAVFISRPIEGYADAARRAELTDIADTALRRITRDLRTALPNSIRVSGSYIEFLQTGGGGRYRSETDAAGAGDILDFSNPAGDTSFEVLGPMPAGIAAGNAIVVYNLGEGSGVSDAYGGGNRSAVSAVAAPIVSIDAKQFPFPSPGRRFQVVQYPVTYHCDLGAQQLRRYWNYAIAPAQPTPPAGGSDALLASRVTDCSFTYAPSGASGRTGVISLTLQIEASGEKVRLFQQAHVSNVP